MTQVRLKNFKCFKDNTVDLASLTILAGRNAVGKSSFIQALCLISKRDLSPENMIFSLKLNDVQNLVSTDEVLNHQAEDRKILIKYEDQSFEFNCPEVSKGQLKLNNLKIVGRKTIPSAPRVKYLSAERVGPRISSDASEDHFDLGFFGEKAWSVLGSIKTHNSRLDEDDRRILSGSSSLSTLKQIESWLSYIVSDSEFRVNIFEAVNQAKVEFRRRGHDSEYLSSTNYGFGVTYSLPIIVLGLTAELDEERLVIVENPEAHLDPQGQSRMGQFLAYVAAQGVRLLIETHSEHVVNGIRIAILKEAIKSEDVLFNFFSNDGGAVAIQKIALNNKAELSSWPKGFMDQEEKDLAEIFKLQKQK